MACCVNCDNINNNVNAGVKDTLASLVKLHPCDILSITGGGSTTFTVTSVDLVQTTAFDIPAGFIHGSIAIEAGTATINGAARPTGYMLSLPPMGGNLRYPIYQVTSVSVGAIIHVNYHTLP